MMNVSSQDWVPKKIFLTKGKGLSKERLTSFELALREAGIASLNLITVSSILPPKCDFVTQDEGTNMLSHGQVVPVVLARSDSNTFGEINTVKLDGDENKTLLVPRGCLHSFLTLEENYQKEYSNQYSAEALLAEAEKEIEQSFRNKIFDLLKEGYSKAKNAVALD